MRRPLVRVVSVPVNDNGFEPPLQHMPNPAMPPVERLGVDAVELAHGLGQIGVRSLKQEMEVVGHQAISMANHVEAAHRQSEDGEKGIPVDVVQENGSLGVAPGGHMVNGSRIFYAEWSGHGEGILRNYSRIMI